MPYFLLIKNSTHGAVESFPIEAVEVTLGRIEFGMAQCLPDIVDGNVFTLLHFPAGPIGKTVAGRVKGQFARDARFLSQYLQLPVDLGLHGRYVIEEPHGQLPRHLLFLLVAHVGRIGRLITQGPEDITGRAGILAGKEIKNFAGFAREPGRHELPRFAHLVLQPVDEITQPPLGHGLRMTGAVGQGLGRGSGRFSSVRPSDSA